jgi:tRNA threonylcarbamoyl adenosine modification protein (Sua5/YciO/YrdC/YwlC family)
MARRFGKLQNTRIFTNHSSMASLITEIHSVSPQPAKIQKVVDALKSGAVILSPTDTGFALGCCLADKHAIRRVRQIRRLPENKHLTFLSDSLANIAEYARVNNHAYRTLKRLIPGPFTFILPATKAVPHYAVDPKRKTTGIRVPSHTLTQALVREHGTPIITITAKHPDKDTDDVEELVELLEPLVDVVVTSESYTFEGESSVIDMTSDDFSIIRRGAGFDSIERNVPELAEEVE